MALEAVRGDADHDRVGGLEGRLVRLEALGLQGAAAGIVLGIEIEHDLAALEAFEGDVAAPGARKRECGGGQTDGEFHESPSFRRICVVGD